MLLSSLPIVVLSFAVMIIGLVLGLGLAAIWIGLPLLAATLVLARWFGALELARLRFAGYPIVQSAGNAGAGIREVLSNGRNWVQFLYAAVVGFVVGLVTWTLAVSWVVIGIGGVTYALWGQLAQRSTESVWLHSTALQWLPGFAPATDLATLIGFETVFYFALGVAFLITLPFVARGLVQVHAAVARGMLSTTPAAGSTDDTATRSIPAHALL